MTKLKPQLIVAGPNKKKGGFASGIGYFLVLIIVFVLGVYVGMKVDDPDLNGEQLAEVTLQGAGSNQDSSNESRAALEVTQKKEADYDIPQSVSLENANGHLKQIEDTNSELSSFDEAQEPENSISIVSDEPALLQTDPVEISLIDEDTYRLQVAAFGNLDQANEVVNGLKLRGYDAYIVTTSNSRGEVWNLIKVGNFNTAQEAWNFSTIFQSKEGGEVFVESLSRGRVYNESLEENNDTL